jgi:riboflavin synthase
MFTGIVTQVGEVVSREPDGPVLRLVVACAYDPESLAVGASISCAGICLTVTGIEVGADGRTLLGFDVSPETLARTTASAWEAGAAINLERSLKVGDELGGHFVYGHIDGVARVLAREELGGAVHFTFAVTPELAGFIAPKGSVALDGTSLTVNVVQDLRFTCMMIPHTLAVTTWAGRKAGDSVNIEVDQMARYAARLEEARSFGFGG